MGETVILSEDDVEKLSKTSKAKATQTPTTHGCVPRHCLQSHSIQKPCKAGIAKNPHFTNNQNMAEPGLEPRQKA